MRDLLSLALCTLLCLTSCEKIELVGMHVEERPVTPPSGTTPEDEEIDLPKEGTLWNGHAVAYASGNTILLLSAREWDDVTSAENADTPEAAADIAAEYMEGEYSGWTIPTTEQAKAMRDRWTGDKIDDLNALFADNGTPITVKDAKGNNVRYLCEDATHSFVWESGTTVSKAGAKATYRLRLVKQIVFSK